MHKLGRIHTHVSEDKTMKLTKREIELILSGFDCHDCLNYGTDATDEEQESIKKKLENEM